MANHTTNLSYITPSGVNTKATNYTADLLMEVDNTVNPSTTNQEVDIALTLANVASLFLVSDKAVVVKVNSTTSPAATITLGAGVPVIWPSGHTSVALVSIFGANLTKVYITNASSTDTAVFSFRSAVDITP